MYIFEKLYFWIYKLLSLKFLWNVCSCKIIAQCVTWLKREWGTQKLCQLIILVNQGCKIYWNVRFPFNQRNMVAYSIHMGAFPSLIRIKLQTCNIDWWFAKQLTLWQQPKHKCTEFFTMRALALDKDAAHNYLLSNFGALFLFVNVFRCGPLFLPHSNIFCIDDILI